MHSIEISSELKNITDVERLIDAVCEEFQMKEDNYGNVLIAVTEAVNNSIVHGNESDPSRKVSVAVSKQDQRIVFSVADEGKGFDFDNLPDPTSPENLEKPHGRGIFLMKNLADDVEFDLNGSKVNITFVLENE